MTEPEKQAIDLVLDEILGRTKRGEPSPSRRYDEAIIVGLVVVPYALSKTFGDAAGFLFGLMVVAVLVGVWLFASTARSADAFEAAFPPQSAARPVAAQLLAKKDGVRARALQYELDRRERARPKPADQQIQQAMAALNVSESASPATFQPIPVQDAGPAERTSKAPAPFSFIPLRPDRESSQKSPGSPPGERTGR